MNKFALLLTGVAAVAALPSSAYAVACATTDITPAALSCAGFYSGNLISNSPADITAQTNALASIGFSGWNGVWVEKVSIGTDPASVIGGTTLNFATLLTGISYIGIHFGAANGATNPPGLGSTGTAFYKINAGTGLDIITVNYAGISNAAIYSLTPTVKTGVPEPGTWAMMLLGMGAVGAFMRRRKEKLTVRYV